jgi:hypothetical protein
LELVNSSHIQPSGSIATPIGIVAKDPEKPRNLGRIAQKGGD